MLFSERLALFNAKVDRLSSFSFFKQMTSDKTVATVGWNRDTGWESAFTGPDNEAIDAAVLTLRQFMQDIDPISLHNMAQAYASASIPAELTAEFAGIRSRINAFLDSATNLSIEEGRSLTIRSVLEIFVYGGLAHSTEPHRSRYRDLSHSSARLRAWNGYLHRRPATYLPGERTCACSL
jgi:hypothetical protein